MADFLAGLAQDQVPFRLFSPNFKAYLFVSRDTKKGDNILEAHDSPDEARNYFVLQAAGRGRYRILNRSTGRYLFVSRDKQDGDNIAEAHDRTDDSRNEFTFEAVSEHRYRIFSPYYGRYLFVSYYRKGGDNVVEANPTGLHRDVFELRPSFNYKRWMELTPGVLDQPLKNVCLPATHDSGSYGFSKALVQSSDTDTYRKIMQEAESIASALSSIPGLGLLLKGETDYILKAAAWPTILGLATTNRRPVGQQLVDGIRCLDLRVYHDARTGQFHIWHGAVGPELGGILDDVRAFLASTRSELVYITLGHFAGFSYGSAPWQAFRKLVEEKLGAYAIRRRADSSGSAGSDPFRSSLRELLSRGGALRSGAILVVSVPTSDLGGDELFFPVDYSPPDNSEAQPVIAGYYTNTDDLGTMLDAQSALFKQAGGRPFALYMTLTPQSDHAQLIFEHNVGVAVEQQDLGVLAMAVVKPLKNKWKGNWTTLEALAGHVNGNLTATVTTRFQAESARPNAITFLYTDFYDGTSAVDLAIGFSKPKVAAEVAVPLPAPPA